MLTHYLKTFSTLRSDTSRSRWTAATKYRAPHKPILLLAVIDLIAQGIIKTNFIEFTPDLGELFTSYWSRVMPPDQRSNIILPYYHLSSDKFWHHIPKPGMEAVLAATRQIRGVAQLGNSGDSILNSKYKKGQPLTWEYQKTTLSSPPARSPLIPMCPASS